MNTPSHQPETYDLFTGLKHCRERIDELIKKDDRTYIIQIAGGSASGKSEKVSKVLAAGHAPGSVQVISMDDYYRGKTWMQAEAKNGHTLNFDEPDALDIPQIQKHLQELKEGKTIAKPIYCMKTSEPTDTVEISPTPIIILEGLFALTEGLHETGDLRIFVYADRPTRLYRRMMRDQERKGQSTETIQEYFAKCVEPMHQKHIEITAKNADIIIQNPLSEREFSNIITDEKLSKELYYS